MKRYYKAWFTDGTNSTAKLVLDTDKFPMDTSISQIRDFFCHPEVIKMKRFCRTGLYDSFEEAFLERTKSMGLIVHTYTLTCPKHANATDECTCWKY